MAIRIVGVDLPQNKRGRIGNNLREWHVEGSSDR